MVIYNASLDLTVVDTPQAIEAVQQIIQAVGGYVAESNSYRREGQLHAAITARVPADQLTQTLAQLRKVALTVEHEVLTSEDVTDQYTDLQSQLRNLQASEQQYLEIMKRADKIEDVLAVQQRLTETRSQIETIQGRIAYLSRSAALATVKIALTPDTLTQPLSASGWRPQGTALAAFNALLMALKTLGDILIWGLVCVLPVALLIGLPLYLGLSRAIRRARRPASPQNR